ncbi:MAG: lysylphosphatidylglycerol synthase transmembrane domain-containing protein [Candidatus Freyarchaeota archaeon]
MPGKGSLLKAAAFILSILVIVAVLWFIGVDLFLALASRLNPTWVSVFIAAYTFSFLLRALRWKIIVGATGKNASFSRLMTINFSGWFVNQVTPAKIGDFLRISLLSSQEHVSLGESTSTIAVERALDVSTIVLVSSILLFSANFSQMIPSHIKLLSIIGFILLAAILALTIAFCVAGPGIVNTFRIHKVSRRIHSALYELALGLRDGVQKLSKSPKALLLSALLSPPIWVIDAFSIYIFVNATGIPQTIQTYMLAVLLGFYPQALLPEALLLYISTAPFSSVSAGFCLLAAILGFASKLFPIIPGGFGIYELVVAIILNITGLSLHVGLAVALIDHMARLTYCSAAGIPSLIHNGIGLRTALFGRVREPSLNYQPEHGHE